MICKKTLQATYYTYSTVILFAVFDFFFRVNLSIIPKRNKLSHESQDKVIFHQNKTF